VAMDSAATWAHADIFRFDKDLVPVVVAGCPPDAFSPTGQLWGNPVYDWKKMKKGGYDWWIQRIERNYEFYDVIRIDHFNGFAEYYEVPYGDETAEHGKVVKGPGIDFFRAVKKELGDVAIIAEDLGNITPATEKLLAGTGYPGMKVLQFAFDPSESSYYLSYNHVKNAVVYTGTHDNTTTRDWIETCSDHDRDFARRFIHSEYTDYGAFTWDFIREAYRSVCDLCIIPIQDYLVKGAEARLNTPGTAQGNWQWRVTPDLLSHELAHSIYELARTYGRLPKPEVRETAKKKEKTAQA
ncbi:MAG: 4-alpha-glucanotransferase, partial [Sarcina sp.]|nr:4-alpha-glucanotransferase [Sarcina sp.]